MPKYIRDIIAIENDDKVFNVSDVIRISKEINVPVVLDYHHHKCNESFFDFADIFDTWKEDVPKIHFSSPRNKKDFRSHSDYIDSSDFIKFIGDIKKFERDIDIMLECKCKDDSLFRLVRQIKYKTDYNFIDDTTFLV